MSYITSYTGKHFDPVEPDVSLLDLRDIAHALSLLCRANGHIRHFYSVAQHCLSCCAEAEALGYSVKVQLACLLHDAAEAYVSDLTRPVKALMQEYCEIEENLLKVIWEYFLREPLTEEEEQQVFVIDDRMLSYEFLKLMPESISDLYRELRTEPDVEFQDPGKIEALFLERCEYLKNKLEKEQKDAVRN